MKIEIIQQSNAHRYIIAGYIKIPFNCFVIENFYFYKIMSSLGSSTYHFDVIIEVEKKKNNNGELNEMKTKI